jgi:hypothetical protein
MKDCGRDRPRITSFCRSGHGDRAAALPRRKPRPESQGRAAERPSGRAVFSNFRRQDGQSNTVFLKSRTRDGPFMSKRNILSPSRRHNHKKYATNICNFPRDMQHLTITAKFLQHIVIAL